MQRGTHYLLHEDAQVNEIRSTVDSRAKSLGMKAGRPKLLFKKCLFTKQDERLISEKAFIHLFFIQAATRPHAPARTSHTPLTHTSHTPHTSPRALTHALTQHLSHPLHTHPLHTHPLLAQAVNDVQRGNYLCKASDAVKLAAIHYYVWHGPFDAAKEQFSVSYMRELRLSEQLMPTPLVTAQVGRGPEMNGPRAAPMPPPARGRHTPRSACSASSVGSADSASGDGGSYVRRLGGAPGRHEHAALPSAPSLGAAPGALSRSARTPCIW